MLISDAMLFLLASHTKCQNYVYSMISYWILICNGFGAGMDEHGWFGLTSQFNWFISWMRSPISNSYSDGWSICVPPSASKYPSKNLSSWAATSSINLSWTQSVWLRITLWCWLLGRSNIFLLPVVLVMFRWRTGALACAWIRWKRSCSEVGELLLPIAIVDDQSTITTSRRFQFWIPKALATYNGVPVVFTLVFGFDAILWTKI